MTPRCSPPVARWHAFYEEVAAAVPGEAKLAANWVMGDFSAALTRTVSK